MNSFSGGKKHKENVRMYYQGWLEQRAKIVDEMPGDESTLPAQEIIDKMPGDGSTLPAQEMVDEMIVDESTPPAQEMVDEMPGDESTQSGKTNKKTYSLAMKASCNCPKSMCRVGTACPCRRVGWGEDIGVT